MNINEEDLLDWDYFIGPDPEQPSGTIEVTLEYCRRGIPDNYPERPVEKEPTPEHIGRPINYMGQ